METHAISTALSNSQFDIISKMINQQCGINLCKGKEQLVKSRLIKRLRALGLRDFTEYLNFLEKDISGAELIFMIDALTTNKTDFFREMQHFEFIRREILPSTGSYKLRFWSAGCSSGEEPYSLAIILHEEIKRIEHRDVKILATDISTKMLKVAREAVYPYEVLREIPEQLLRKYFTRVQNGAIDSYRIIEPMRSMVRLARLNLIDPWPMRGLFDVIFCRNVMIYFDAATRGTLVRRFFEKLKPGGYLFVGHSENLTALSHKFDYVQPTIYKRVDATARALKQEVK